MRGLACWVVGLQVLVGGHALAEPGGSVRRDAARTNDVAAAPASRPRHGRAKWEYPKADPEPGAAESMTAPARVRFALRGGVDAGTLVSATAYLSATASYLVGALEWRALVGFGLPTTEEHVDLGVREWQREHFLLLDLGACYGGGARWRIAACAAGEFVFIDSVQGGGDVQIEGGAGRLGGVLAAELTYRGSVVQPELELAAVALAFGQRQGASTFAFRASLGLGMQF